MSSAETPDTRPEGTPLEAHDHSYRFIDIGSNLGDPVFRGEYHGKQAHPNDFQQILNRARSAGVVKQILTGDCLSGSREVRLLALENGNYRVTIFSIRSKRTGLRYSPKISFELTGRRAPLFSSEEGLYATVGCHPCRANEFEAGGRQDTPEDVEQSAEAYLAALDQLIADDQASGQSRVVAVGECGLDYDRLSHCSKETQSRHFPPQLELATKYQLPLFLHSRTSEAHTDFVRIIRTHEARHPAAKILPARRKGVVHSFTGSLDEMNELVGLGFSIGINGCSLKTEENLQVVKAVPLDRIMLETDCPWCEIRPSHASHRYLSEMPMKEVFLPPAIKKEKHQVADDKMVKGRNEPCTIGQVAWVVSKLKGIPLSEVTQNAWQNSVDMFALS